MHSIPNQVQHCQFSVCNCQSLRPRCCSYVNVRTYLNYNWSASGIPCGLCSLMQAHKVTAVRSTFPGLLVIDFLLLGRDLCIPKRVGFWNALQHTTTMLLAILRIHVKICFPDANVLVVLPFLAVFLHIEVLPPCPVCSTRFYPKRKSNIRINRESGVKCLWQIEHFLPRWISACGPSNGNRIEACK